MALIKLAAVEAAKEVLANKILDCVNEMDNAAEFLVKSGFTPEEAEKEVNEIFLGFSRAYTEYKSSGAIAKAKEIRRALDNGIIDNTKADELLKKAFEEGGAK